MNKRIYLILSLLWLLPLATLADGVVKGTVTLNGQTIEAEYYIQGSTARLGSGYNACIPQYSIGKVEVPYYIIDEKYHFGGHGSKSVFLVQQFMKLTTEEAAAINCHMGFSDGSATTVRDVSNAYHQFPLAWIVHVADEAATFLLDR